jgi:hypothetical protein
MVMARETMALEVAGILAVIKQKFKALQAFLPLASTWLIPMSKIMQLTLTVGALVTPLPAVLVSVALSIQESDTTESVISFLG